MGLLTDIGTEEFGLLFESNKSQELTRNVSSLLTFSCLIMSLYIMS